MEHSTSGLATGFHRQALGRGQPAWTAGGSVGDDAGADQLLGLLLEKVDERHAQYERECNDRFARAEAAQEELTRRLSAVRLLARCCPCSHCSACAACASVSSAMNRLHNPLGCASKSSYCCDMQAEAAVEAALDAHGRQVGAGDGAGTQLGREVSVAAVEDSLIQQIRVLEKKHNSRMDDACVIVQIVQMYH